MEQAFDKLRGNSWSVEERKLALEALLSKFSAKYAFSKWITIVSRKNSIELFAEKLVARITQVRMRVSFNRLRERAIRVSKVARVIDRH